MYQKLIEDLTDKGYIIKFSNSFVFICKGFNNYYITEDGQLYKSFTGGDVLLNTFDTVEDCLRHLREFK